MADSVQIAQIENAIVGGLLLWPEYTGEVVSALSPEHFSSPIAKRAFEAVSSLFFKDAPIDAVTVANEANLEYELVAQDLMRCATAGSNLSYYCDLLKEQTQLLRIQAEARAIAFSETIQEARAGLNQLNGLMVSRKEVEILSAADAASTCCIFQEGEKPEYLPWGIPALDKALYAELGDFIVVGGYPSAGKTLLSLQFALTLSEKYRVGYFSLETSTRKLSDRVMSHLAKVPLAKIKQRDLNEADVAAMVEAAKTLSTRMLDYIDAGGMTVRDIQAVALNMRYQVVFVDYLQLVADSGRGRYEQVTSISQGLHTLARANGITVIALAQLRRAEKENGKPKPPTMSDFRESGQIEQDADVAMLLWPADPNDNQSGRVLKVGKNKEGDRLKLELDFDGATQTLSPHVPTQGERFREVQSHIRKAAREANRQVTMSDLEDPDKDLPF